MKKWVACVDQGNKLPNEAAVYSIGVLPYMQWGLKDTETADYEIRLEEHCSLFIALGCVVQK